MNFRTIRAVLKRDFFSYFGSLTGYVFVLALLVVAFLLAFYPNRFFPANKANLDLLSAWMPLLLLVFVPLVTMSSWARERERGTHELLLTLPAQDHELVIAKFGAYLLVYAVALGFTLPFVAVLEYVGTPDLGLMASTYLGYLLLGAAGVAMGLLASSLTSNVVVAFVLGVLFCFALAVPDLVASNSGARWAAAVGEVGALRRFEALTRGVLDLQDVLYFVAVVATALYANTYVLGRRHWTQARDRMAHGGIRLACIYVAGLCLVVLLGRAVVRVDLTTDQMLALAPEAREVLDRLDSKRPVLVQAWISPDVPEEYRPTRETLIQTLKEFDAHGGERVEVAIHETELFSEAAQRAEKTFGIKPQAVPSRSQGKQGVEQVFLGLAFTCGVREETIPFFDRGLPVQYELTRSIGSVAQVERSKVGVLKSGADLFGSFDFQTMNKSEDWEVLRDLRRQYEVTNVDGTAPIDTSLDVLLVPMPSSLPQEKMDRLAEYLFQGGKALLLCDPFPEFNRDLAPLRPAGGKPNNPFQPPAPAKEPKGAIEPLLAAMGVSWAKDRTVWQDYNPHPEWDTIPQQLVFVSPTSADGKSGFNEQDPVTSGLQELAFIFAGELEPAEGTEVTFTPLVSAGPSSGSHAWSEMVQESFFGIIPQLEGLRYEAKGKPRVLAARVAGKLRAPADGATMKRGELSQKPFEAIVVADMDLISDVFFALRRQGSTDFSLDNVSFVANCIDSLAGEEAYLELRKRRPRHRTLSLFEEIDQAQNEVVRNAAKAARDQAEAELKVAQETLTKKVEAIEARTDLDYRTKQIMLETMRQREQRKLQLAERRIKDEESAAVRQAKGDAKLRVEAQKNLIISVGGILCAWPVLALGLFVLGRKMQRERAGIDPARRRAS